ncbi:MAG: GTP-binding protein [Desulfobacteraceae bacterium]|nr:GTP-binding protein [Desulfobacteraceae bacterium]
MSKDLENIEIIAQKLGIVLRHWDGDRDSFLSWKTGIAYLPDEHENVIGLNLYNCGLNDISFLKLLPNLTQLDLSYSQLSDISVLKFLPNLTQLNLSGNQLSDISVLKFLSNLTQLDLSYNELTNISVLKFLPNLTQLDLSDNGISDISVLKFLPNLTQLDLGGDVEGNGISDISVLKFLPNLTQLDLSLNQIRELPRFLPDLNMEIVWEEEGYFFAGINLYNNPIETPPLEIVKKGRSAIESYFRSLETGKKPLNEVKVLIVGDGGSGKTSLIKQIFGEAFDKNESQTHGIRIRHWNIETENRNIKVRFWDFGGQEIMHATHQFFLSKRSLYILVSDGRKEGDPEYWLKHIESFGGSSPVLIILNKTDENPGFDLNRNFLKKKYSGIKNFYRVSCAAHTGIDEFSDSLRKELADVELIQTEWPESWFNVKTALENMTAPYISYKEYRNECGKEKITITEDQNVLVAFLNDLGVILHFKDFRLLDTHVLEPKWVTEAVYKIINSKQLAENRGILNLCSLDDILKQETEQDYCYHPEKYQYIISLMLKFELCYEVDKDAVLVPDLLEVPEPVFDFDDENALKFIFEYDFLPKSVMPRFIVKQHRDIKNNLRWRTGVVLEDKNFSAAATVKADIRDRKIFIHVTGDQKRDYFSVIRKTFKDIHSSFEKLDVKEQIPLPDNPHITVEYEELVGYELMNEDQYKVGKLRKTYSVSKLLNGIEKKEERIREQVISVHYHEHGNFEGNSEKEGNRMEEPKNQKEQDTGYRMQTWEKVIIYLSVGLFLGTVCYLAITNRHDPNVTGYQIQTWEKLIVYIAGLLFIGMICYLVINDKPVSNPNLIVFIRTLLSLFVAALGATVPGMLNVDFSGGGLLVRATGALALFVITFFATPRVIK